MIEQNHQGAEPRKAPSAAAVYMYTSALHQELTATRTAIRPPKAAHDGHNTRNAERNITRGTDDIDLQHVRVRVHLYIRVSYYIMYKQVCRTRRLRRNKLSRRLLLRLSSGLRDGETDEGHHERHHDDHEHRRDRDRVLPRQEEVLHRMRRVHKRL